MLFYIRSILCFPVLLSYLYCSKKVRENIDDDLKAYAKAFRIDESTHKFKKIYTLLYSFIRSKSFRTIFYYRIGNKLSCILRIIWKPENSFHIDYNCKISGGFYAPHAYSTIINAKYIGKNFVCRNCTTIGNKVDGRNDLIPIIGDNVVLGCNVVIVGSVKIGNNVIIGAGTVVVKDVPDNCKVVGSSARIYEQ